MGDREIPTLETGLAPTKEIEERQPEGDVKTKALRCEVDHVRDGNINNDSE